MKKYTRRVISVLISFVLIFSGNSMRCIASESDTNNEPNQSYDNYESDEDISFLSEESKYVNNIRWGTDSNEGTLYWEAYEGASYYIVSCGERKNVKVTKTYYDFSAYMNEKGTYIASIVAYGSDGGPLTYVCSSPAKIIDYNTYTIKCYIAENDKTPIITSDLSMNKSYLLKMYSYTDKDDDFQLEVPTLENYDFVGWSLAGTTKTQNPVTISPDTGNKTYIARWQGKTFNLIFDSQGGSAVQTKECRYGSAMGTFPTATRENYKFDGWYTESVGGTLASASDKMPANDVTYYAHWTPVNFIIELHNKEDEIIDGVKHSYVYKQIEYNIESEDIVLPEISEEGYFFDGWVGEGIETPQKNVVIPHGSSGHRDYYAKWSVNPCAYEHTYENIITPATTTTDGEIVPTCKNCGKTKSAIKISRIDSVSLSSNSYTYNGIEKKPTVQIKSSSGEVLEADTDYMLSYENNVNVGTSTVTIVFKGKYSGTLNENFKINPKGTTISSLDSESKKITIKWREQSTQTTGYQIEYTWPAKIATSKTVTIDNNTSTSKVISNLVNNRDYYLRIRTYKTVNGTKYYSSWSSQKKVHVGEVQLSAKSATMYRGQKKQLTLKYIPSGAKPTWKSSNKKIATVSSSGKITAKGLGKVTISATYKGKTYKATINVAYLRPDMAALLYDYNTHDNYFVLTIKNNSKKTMTVLSGTTKVVDCDYKKFDRSVKLSKSVTIKPGETKKIKFKVIGSVTWYDYTDFTLYYKFKLDGKAYDAKSDCFVTSKYKKGSSWVKTYRDEDWFIDWRCEAIPDD